MSFLFQYEIKQSDAYGIHIVSMTDTSGKPYRIHRDLVNESEALRVASEIAAAHREQGHRCHVHNSLGQRTDL